MRASRGGAARPAGSATAGRVGPLALAVALAVALALAARGVGGAPWHDDGAGLQWRVGGSGDYALSFDGTDDWVWLGALALTDDRFTLEFNLHAAPLAGARTLFARHNDLGDVTFEVQVSAEGTLVFPFADSSSVALEDERHVVAHHITLVVQPSADVCGNASAQLMPQAAPPGFVCVPRATMPEESPDLHLVSSAAHTLSWTEHGMEAHSLVAVYRNGALIRNVTVDSPSVPAVSGTWFAGARNTRGSNGVVRSHFFRGVLDNVRFWNRSLASDEIAELMVHPILTSEATNLHGVSCADLVAAFPFEEGDGILSASTNPRLKALLAGGNSEDELPTWIPSPFPLIGPRLVVEGFFGHIVPVPLAHEYFLTGSGRTLRAPAPDPLLDTVADIATTVRTCMRSAWFPRATLDDSIQFVIFEPPTGGFLAEIDEDALASALAREDVQREASVLLRTRVVNDPSAISTTLGTVDVMLSYAPLAPGCGILGHPTVERPWLHFLRRHAVFRRVEHFPFFVGVNRTGVLFFADSVRASDSHTWNYEQAVNRTRVTFRYTSCSPACEPSLSLATYNRTLFTADLVLRRNWPTIVGISSALHLDGGDAAVVLGDFNLHTRELTAEAWFDFHPPPPMYEGSSYLSKIGPNGRVLFLFGATSRAFLKVTINDTTCRGPAEPVGMHHLALTLALAATLPNGTAVPARLLPSQTPAGTLASFIIDGAFAGQCYVPAFLPSNTMTGLPWTLGRARWSLGDPAVTYGTAGFHGAVDELRVWNLVRSPAQIRASFGERSDRFNANGLLFALNGDYEPEVANPVSRDGIQSHLSFATLAKRPELFLPDEPNPQRLQAAGAFFAGQLLAALDSPRVPLIVPGQNLPLFGLTSDRDFAPISASGVQFTPFIEVPSIQRPSTQYWWAFPSLSASLHHNATRVFSSFPLSSTTTVFLVPREENSSLCVNVIDRDDALGLVDLTWPPELFRATAAEVFLAARHPLYEELVRRPGGRLTIPVSPSTLVRVAPRADGGDGFEVADSALCEPNRVQSTMNYTRGTICLSYTSGAFDDGLADVLGRASESSIVRGAFINPLNFTLDSFGLGAATAICRVDESVCGLEENDLFTVMAGGTFPKDTPTLIVTLPDCPVLVGFEARGRDGNDVFDEGDSLLLHFSEPVQRPERFNLTSFFDFQPPLPGVYSELWDSEGRFLRLVVVDAQVKVFVEVDSDILIANHISYGPPLNGSQTVSLTRPLRPLVRDCFPVHESTPVALAGTWGSKQAPDTLTTVLAASLGAISGTAVLAGLISACLIRYNAWKSAERRKEEERKVREQYAERRNNFVGFVVHELRAPYMGIEEGIKSLAKGWKDLAPVIIHRRHHAAAAIHRVRSHGKLRPPVHDSRDGRDGRDGSSGDDSDGDSNSDAGHYRGRNNEWEGERKEDPTVAAAPGRAIRSMMEGRMGADVTEDEAALAASSGDTGNADDRPVLHVMPPLPPLPPPRRLSRTESETSHVHDEADAEDSSADLAVFDVEDPSPDAFAMSVWDSGFPTINRLHGTVITVRQLMNDFLDLAKIESGKHELMVNPEPVNLPAHIVRTCEQVESVALVRQIRIAIRIHGHVSSVSATPVSLDSSQAGGAFASGSRKRSTADSLPAAHALAGIAPASATGATRATSAAAATATNTPGTASVVAAGVPAAAPASVVDPAHMTDMPSHVLHPLIASSSWRRDNATKLSAANVVSVQTEGAFPTLLADPTRIGQIVRNFVTNAIKFAPVRSTVVVDLRTLTPDEANATLDFAESQMDHRCFRMPSPALIGIADEVGFNIRCAPEELAAGQDPPPAVAAASAASSASAATAASGVATPSSPASRARVGNADSAAARRTGSVDESAQPWWRCGLCCSRRPKTLKSTSTAAASAAAAVSASASARDLASRSRLATAATETSPGRFAGPTLDVPRLPSTSDQNDPTAPSMILAVPRSTAPNSPTSSASPSVPGSSAPSSSSTARPTGGDRRKPRAEPSTMENGELRVAAFEGDVFGSVDVRRLIEVTRDHVVASGRVSVLLRVLDTGGGMDNDAVQSLFNPFVQVKSSTARTAGTGLGLFIARYLAHRHGGFAWLDWSCPRRGSCFAILLPLAESDRAAINIEEMFAHALNEPAAEGSTTVLESTPVAEPLIAAAGVGVEMSPAAAAAAAAARRLSDATAPRHGDALAHEPAFRVHRRSSEGARQRLVQRGGDDVVEVDDGVLESEAMQLQLGAHSGAPLASQGSAVPSPPARSPAITTTRTHEPAARVRHPVLELGASLGRSDPSTGTPTPTPGSFASGEERVPRHRSLRGQRGAATGPRLLVHGRVPRVLVVDDEPTIRVFLERRLTSRGVTVVAVADGWEAVAALHGLAAGSIPLDDRDAWLSRPVDGSRFDAIICDAHLEELHGPEFVHSVRRAGFPNPIVGMTASTDEVVVGGFVRQGLTSVLLKPFEDKDIVSALERAFENIPEA